jgi:Protein of unknown function (DUF3828)
MISRRAFVLAVLPAALSFAYVEAAETTAKDFIESIYAAYKGKDAKGVPIDRTADLNRYFAPALVKLINKDRAAANRRHEVPTLDGDPFVDAQDWEIDSFDITVRDTGAGKAAATVSFKNIDMVKSVVLDLVKLKAGWRISEIAYDNKETLSGLFKPSKAR